MGKRLLFLFLTLLSCISTIAQPCNITDPGIGNITCDDFGTADPNDDFPVIELNPTGQGLGSFYNVTSLFTSPSPGFANYGVTTAQNLILATAPNPQITLTIIDGDDPGCTETFTIDNPCFNAATCDLTNPGLGFTECNDNGTPNDPSDDFYTFPLNPVGTGLGSGYTVTVSAGTVSPPGGNYGSETTFTLTGVAPPLGISVIVTDNDDPNCITNTIINLPPPCSTVPSCDINFAQIGNITCSDNGTPSNPDDDTFTFILQVVGTNTSPSGWTTSDPLSTTGQYDVVTTMGPYPISGGGFTVVATDNDDPNCSTIPVNIVPPAPCSSNPICNLTNSGLFSVSCVEAGTPGDPSDDYAAFTLNPTGTNLGSLYTVSISPGTITPPQGVYGATTSFFTGPGSGSLGDFTVTITDQDDPNCTLTFTLPNPCSGVANCSITDVDIGFVNCVDNSTPSDPSDDYILFSLSPNGTGLGNTYTVTSPSGPITPNQGTYGVMNFQTFQAPLGTAGAGDLQITVTDANDPNCTFTLTIPDPGSCSNTPACNLTSLGQGPTVCDDNGTPGDPSDDIYTFTLDPQGTGLGSGYSVTAGIGTFSPTIGTYGAPTTFTFSAPAGSTISIFITDNEDSNCILNSTVFAEPCPLPPCDIQDAGLSAVACNDASTPSDPSDDFIDFNLNPSGLNLGSQYQVTTSFGNITPSTGIYGTTSSFQTSPGTAGNGPITITIADIDDPSCSLQFILSDPGTCSNTPACTVTDAGVLSAICDDAGTPANPGDDFVVLELFPTGVTLGSGYTLSSPDVTVSPANGAYGIASVFQLQGAANAVSPISLTITDLDNQTTCFLNFTIDNPAPCAVACDIQALAASPVCNDNGTPTIPGDDIFTVDITVNGTGSGWQADDPASTNGAFGQTATFGPYPISDGPVALTFSIIGNPACEALIIVDPPSPCSDACSLEADVVDTQCDDNGTPATTSDDTYTATIVVTGTNAGSGWTAGPPANTSGTYGNATVVGPFSTAQSEATFDITDNDDPQCNITFSIPSTGGCSSGCPEPDSTFLADASCNPLDTGVQVVTLTNTIGCDSLVITTTTLLPSDTTLIGLESCNPSDTGRVEELLLNQFGCDSLVVTTTTLLLSDTTLINLESCNPADTGTVEELLANEFGCDSLVVTTTTLLPSDTTLIGLESCNPSDTGRVEELLLNQFGCDSLVITTTTLLASDTTWINLESCNSLDTGTVETLLSNQFGCDSLIVTTTTLLPSDSIFIELTSCNPADTGTVEELLVNEFGCDSLVVTTTSFALSDTTLVEEQSCNPLDTGIVETLLSNQFGCDSLVITSTTLLPGDTAFINLESCNPADTGTVEELLVNEFGCDSLVVTTTTLLPSDTTFISLESCNPVDTGTVEELLANEFGCDSLVVTTTTLLPSDTTFVSLESCSPVDTGTVEELLANEFGCDSLVVTTTTLLPSDTAFVSLESCNPVDTGTVEELLANEFGCDSLVVTTTTLLPSDTAFVSLESCNPVDTGTVEELLANEFGCDSLVVTTTTLLPSDTAFVSLESCNPADTGTVEELLANEFGCDSLVVTTTTLLPSDTTFVNLESCNPVDTGTVEELLVNEFGCDSLVVTTTTLLPSDTTFISLESCNPADSGSVETLLSNQFGCDSLVITTTILLPGDTIFVNLESCNPADTGTVEEVLSNEFGCDSLVFTTTTLLPSDTTFVSLESCNPVDTGTVEELLSNEFGCDSLVVTTTTLLPSDTAFVSLESCNPADTGTVEELLSNEFGCDSLVVITTTLLPSDTAFVSLQSCNPADTGTVEELLSNEFGCDSLVVTTTTLLPSDTAFVSLESCNPVDTGTVEEVLSNEFGCDSLVVTTTTLLPSDTTFVSLESCNPVDTGTVEEVLINEFGCDSLVVTTTALLPNDTTFLTPIICPGDSILVNGQYYSEELLSGVDTFVSANGCDSLVFIDLSFYANPEVQSIDTVLCAGEELHLFGQVFDETMPGGAIALQGQSGCDSLLIVVNLSFSEPSAELLSNSPDCVGLAGSIELNGVSGGFGPYSYELDGLESGQVAGGSLLLDNILPGNYTLTLMDSLGCEGSTSITIQEGLEPVVGLGADIDTVLGASITLNPFINFEYDTLIWQPAEAVDCEGCPSPAVIATESVNIQLTAISEEGCVAEDMITILLNKERKVYIPNIFSPNGDGRNDFFTIFADPDQVLSIEEFAIYDRWGNQVFRNEGFPANVESEGWDGIFQGEPMDPAVFVYYARLEFTDGEVILFKGDITLLR